MSYIKLWETLTLNFATSEIPNCCGDVVAICNTVVRLFDVVHFLSVVLMLCLHLSCGFLYDTFQYNSVTSDRILKADGTHIGLDAVQ